MFDGLMDFLQSYPALVAVTLFVLAFGESLVVISLFIPATALFLLLGGLQQASGGAFVPIFVAGAAGAFIGDLVSYVVARRFKDELPRRWPFRDNPKWLTEAARFLNTWGLPGVVGSKFLGPMRALTPAVCGVLLMPLPRFLAATVLSCLIWSGLLLAPTYYGAQVFGM